MRSRDGAWLTDTGSAPAAARRLRKRTDGRPAAKSCADRTDVAAPASPFPMMVAGIQTSAIFPAEERRTSDWATPAISPEAARARTLLKTAAEGLMCPPAGGAKARSTAGITMIPEIRLAPTVAGTHQ